MSHDVEFTGDAVAWWTGLTLPQQVDVANVVELLAARGSAPGSPQSSRVQGSTHLHMRELEIPSGSEPMRIFYANDPRDTAILLTGGRKADQDRAYLVHVRRADALYHEHLDEIRRERRLKRESGHRRPWRELFERLPVTTQAEVRQNTARVLSELNGDDLNYAGGGVGRR